MVILDFKWFTVVLDLVLVGFAVFPIGFGQFLFGFKQVL